MELNGLHGDGDAADLEVLLSMGFLNQPDGPELHGILHASLGDRRRGDVNITRQVYKHFKSPMVMKAFGCAVIALTHRPRILATSDRS